MPVAIQFVLRHEKPRMAPAAAMSLTTHVFVIVVLVLFRYAPRQSVIPPGLSEKLNQSIVWLSERGPGGGGGGGGDRSKEPARQAVLTGRDAMTVPARKPSSIEPSSTPTDVAAPRQPEIPVKPMASGADMLPGVITTLPGPPTASQGPGAHGGAGMGTDGGNGPGRGPGLGDGSDGNFGGGVPAPGNGVTTPILLQEVKPGYTSDAMRAKVQGSVLVQCIVNADGSVGDARVVRSLDPVFGLDQEALRAARQWRFRPGTLRGQAVPVRITIELTFTLR
jgi:protein TonB